MMQSLPGLFKRVEAALQKSPDEYSCMAAFSVGELIDNLRLLKDGDATLEEFFKVYVFDSNRRDLADSVKADRFVCMADDNTEVEDVD